MSNSVPEIEKIIKEQLADLNRLKDRVLPVKVGRAVMESTRQNFREGGFYGRKWEDTKRRAIGFDGADGRYGPLLSRQNHLMSSTDYIPGQGRVTIQNAAEYAQIHNEGGHIPVTIKMRPDCQASCSRTVKAREANKKRMHFPVKPDSGKVWLSRGSAVR